LKKALEMQAKRLLSRETLPAFASGVDLEGYDRKVVADYTLPDGRLKTIPAQRKARSRAALHRPELTPGLRYSEKQVNEILSRYHEDTATLEAGTGWLQVAYSAGWRRGVLAD
jgi:hypothetical protein